MSTLSSLDGICPRLRSILDAKHAAREQAINRSRELIRYCANSIRATHRGEFEEAEALLAEAKSRHQINIEPLRGQPDIYWAGYVQDSAKELAEAAITLAVVRGDDLPTPEELQVEPAPYLNGLGEAMGEMGRHILDLMRLGDMTRAEEILQVMNDVYGVLVTFDYPDSLTGGLRRTTDMVRGVLERSRGDLTVILANSRLEKALNAAHEEFLRAR
jgi:translin